MTCWQTKECAETILGLETEGCIVVSDCMLISILSMSVEGADALAPQAWDLKLADLSPCI